MKRLTLSEALVWLLLALCVLILVWYAFWPAPRADQQPAVPTATLAPTLPPTITAALYVPSLVPTMAAPSTLTPTATVESTPTPEASPTPDVLPVQVPVMATPTPMLKPPGPPAQIPQRSP